MTDDLSDLYAELRRLRKDVDRLQTATPLQNSSVGRGRLRFFNNSQLLIQDSNLDVTGTATIIGTLRTVGRIILEGLGILTVNGLIDLLGRMRVNGGGGITVEGGGDVVVDGGEIRVGNVVLRDGKIFVGEGANQIVIDGATGEIIAGGMRVNPGVNGGQIEFGDERTINAGSNYLGIYDGDRFVLFNEAGVTVYAGGSSIAFTAEGIRATGLTNHQDMDGRRWVTVDGGGLLGMIDPAFGGPGAGQFEYPFPESTITYGFRPPDRPTHNGLDMAGPGVTGQMIPSAARGVVSFAGGSDGEEGYGYYVVVDHGSIDGDQVETLYGHMKTAPIVAVGQTVQKRDPLGPVGDTGNSYGDHLHWEIRVNGVPVDPQIFMQRYTA